MFLFPCLLRSLLYIFFYRKYRQCHPKHCCLYRYALLLKQTYGDILQNPNDYRPASGICRDLPKFTGIFHLQIIRHGKFSARKTDVNTPLHVRPVKPPCSPVLPKFFHSASKVLSLRMEELRKNNESRMKELRKKHQICSGRRADIVRPGYSRYLPPFTLFTILPLITKKTTSGNFFGVVRGGARELFQKKLRFFFMILRKFVSASFAQEENPYNCRAN